jgi:hypothetical protein
MCCGVPPVAAPVRAVLHRGVIYQSALPNHADMSPPLCGRPFIEASTARGTARVPATVAAPDRAALHRGAVEPTTPDSRTFGGSSGPSSRRPDAVPEPGTAAGGRRPLAGGPSSRRGGAVQGDAAVAPVSPPLSGRPFIEAGTRSGCRRAPWPRACDHGPGTAPPMNDATNPPSARPEPSHPSRKKPQVDNMPRTPGQARTQSQQPYLAAFAASTQRARSEGVQLVPGRRPERAALHRGQSASRITTMSPRRRP